MIPYIIRTFRGGVSDESKRGIPGAFKFGQSLDIHSRDDVLKCGSSVVTANESLISDLMQFLVPAADGSTYAFGSAGSIYARTGDLNDGAWNFAYNDENGNIKGAGEFELNDGTRYMIWCTNTSVARRNMTTGEKAVPWTNVTANYRTTLNSVDWHTTLVAAGQFNIANGNDLASISYADAFTASDLDIIPGNLIKSLEERDDFIILGSERSDESEEGHIWSWIVTASSWVQKKRVPAKGVNALITAELGLAQAGAQGELFQSDFINQIPLHGVPGGGQVYPGGASILDDRAVFGFFGGTYPGIWSYGRKRKDRPFALNYEYRLAKTVAGSSISTIGAIAVVNGDLIASWGTTDGSTSDYGVDQVSSTTKASALYEGLEFDGGSPHLAKTVDTIAFVMTQLPSGTSVSAKFKMDKESDWRYAVLGSGATTFSQSGEVVALFNVGKPGRIYEVGAELNASGADSPEIHAIISYLSKKTSQYA